MTNITNLNILCVVEPFFKDQHTNVIMFSPPLEVITAGIFSKFGEPEVGRVPTPGMFMFTV